MTDRITGLSLLVLTAWYGWSAWNLRDSIFSDPLGTRAFPLVVATAMVPLALYLLFRRAPATVTWPSRDEIPVLLVTLVAFFAYSILMKPLGFIASTILAFTLLARVFGSDRRGGLVAAVVATGVLYLLFGIVLDLYLPTGEVFERFFR